MRAIGKQLLWLAATVCALYGLALALSFVVLPATQASGALDTGSAASSLYMTEPKYVFMSRSALANPQARVILLGASNIVVGVKPRELAPLLPGVQVDNLAVGGSNITQVSQIESLVQEVQGDDARRQTTYVIGIWYGMFAENHAKWYTPERHAGDTDIDIERYRYGFYRRSDAGPVALLPARDLSFGVMLIHPYLVLDKVSRDATRRVRDLVFGHSAERTDEERNATVLTDSDKNEALRYWQTQIQSPGRLGDEQFAELSLLVERILASGSKVVLVDLPLPHWHETRSPYMPSYVAQRDQIVDAFKGRPGFSFVEMSAQDADLDFSDEVHPKPRVTPRWAQTLGGAIQQALAETTTTARGATP